MAVNLQDNLLRIQPSSEWSFVMKPHSALGSHHIEIFPSAGVIQESNEFGQSVKETYLRSIEGRGIRNSGDKKYGIFFKCSIFPLG